MKQIKRINTRPKVTNHHHLESHPRKGTRADPRSLTTKIRSKLSHKPLQLRGKRLGTPNKVDRKYIYQPL